MVARFQPHAGWMKFTSLDRYSNPLGIYTLCWRFKDGPDECWTQRVNDFKAAKSLAVTSAMWTLSEALPKLLRDNDWKAGETGLSVALGSGDTILVPSKPLPTLGRNASEVSKLTWLPNLLTKVAHRSLHGLSNMAERDAEVAEKYTARAAPTEIKRVLLLDDIVTRGATFREIHRAIALANPRLDVVPLALAKSETKDWAASFGHDLSNQHVPIRWAVLWDKREEAVS